jgi:hypothetical protein
VSVCFSVVFGRLERMDSLGTKYIEQAGTAEKVSPASLLNWAHPNFAVICFLRKPVFHMENVCLFQG